jgi:hypothetical protein
MHMIWCSAGLLFATLDGKVKRIETSHNRMHPVADQSLPVAAVVCTELASICLLAIGWADGTVQSVTIPVESSSQASECKTLFRWTCGQFAMCVAPSAQTLCSGGSDGRLHFLPFTPQSTANEVQAARQTIDLQHEINCVAASTAGDFVVAASGRKLLLFSVSVTSRDSNVIGSSRVKSARSSVWSTVREVPLSGAPLCRLRFAPDGSRVLCVGTCGTMNVLKVGWKTRRVAGGHQVSYVGRNQVNVRFADQTEVDSPLSIRSQYAIVRIRVLADRFVVAWTTGSLVFACWPSVEADDGSDSIVLKASREPITAELKWNRRDEKTRFCFDFDNVILLQSAGELHVMQWNTSELLASVRTQYFSPHLLRCVWCLSMCVSSLKFNVTFIRPLCFIVRTVAFDCRNEAVTQKRWLF